ncbi:hypothetical protein [Reyranella sp.]|jgi:hypothetical protein|uniref:hypothetical protein n=1 Tax=Reyranella sp. TaxID=1929291 RepID=UPI000BCB278A|nr:hypothetical protein [Reyranella sp.]OYY44100.1 MAG: hypothetical protein B7Y57_07955 [Rhodospirillales bacterium 35-66-84]OYZ94776.1 MAG: hypothetical protein B7Y08_10835 [Rhodospirillales bacterium 24-66-33]OZB26149.1 MAG: hypothetical protein B7X63_09375 [Rhodospirillales bacterium 39-66-50]HQS15143.1 hypothetical protein [Reyranella sp.]HQT10952.1 hypothetical protein [Reyranella sp.]
MANFWRIAFAGFVAGALSVLVFHQWGFYLAAELGFGQPNLYNMRPVPPWGVPAIVSLAFWGGLWGALGAFVVARLPGMLNGALGWILFASTLVLAVSWFVVLPMKGAPIGGGWRLPGVIVVPIVYALWGFGMWLFYGLVRRLLK